MPQVITGIQLLLSSLAASYAAASIFTKIAIQIGTTIVLTKVSKLLGPKAPRVRDFPQDVEYSDTMASRRILYGQNKVGGMNVIPPLVTGNEGQHLHQVLALAGHEVNDIGAVFFNKEELSLDISGDVFSGPYTGRASVRKYLGTSTQTVDTILNSALAEWTTDHRGRGIAYLALRYQFDSKVYTSGKPEVTCIVQGKKVYDPRLDVSPGANPTNATYAAYSTNPALCLADYLLASYGLSEAASRVDWALVVAAANICDEDVNIPGSATQKRFTCNLVLDAISAYETNIEALALAMMGTCYYSGGKWRMYAGAWSSSAFTIAADNVVGELSIQTAASRKSDGYYNAVRGRFIDKDRDYQALEFEPILNSTYELEDGERIYTEVDFPACNNQYEAQRNAIILSKQSRRQKIVTVVCDFSAYKIRPWETGTATIAEVGWSNQPVRCVGWRFRPDPAVELTLQEVAATDYDDPDPNDYVTPASVSVTNPAAYKPGAPQSFTATQEIESILLQWQAPTNTIAGILYQVFEHSAATPFTDAVQIYEGADTQLRVPRTDTDTRYFWVRSFYAPSDGFSGETPSGAGLSSSGRAATVSGYLTNEVVALEADSTGTINSYSTAVGFFKVFSGTTDVTSSATFAEVSETNVAGDINTADDTPVSGQPKGYYRVTALSGGDTGTYTISASYGGATITKDFAVTKVQDGTAGVALNIFLTQSSIAVPADSDGANPNLSDAITTVNIYEGQNDVSSSWSVTASPSTGITGSLATRTYTVTGMVVDTGFVEFTATRSGYDNLVIRLALTKIRAGAVGPTGPSGELGGISAILDPEFAGVMAYADGTVISFDPAQGQYNLFLGEENITGNAILSVTPEDCTGTINTATDTPVLGKPKGYYRITAMTADTARLIINASVQTGLGKILMEDGFDLLLESGFFLQTEGSFSLTKTFGVTKSKVGYEIVNTLPTTDLFEGRIVFLTTDDKLYRYNGTAWTTSVPTSDLTGQVTQTQIADAAISATKFASGLRPVEIVNSLPAAGTQGRVVFLTTDNKLYRDTGTTWTAAVPTVDLTGTIVEAQIANAAINTAKFAAGIRPVEIVSTLPAAGTVGRVVFLTTDNKLYRDTGTAWTTAVPAVDITGQLVNAQIADAAINTAKFASGIRPVEIVNFLPAAGTQGRIVFLTSDNKLYRDTGTEWTAVVAAADITGQLVNAQIADAAINTAKFASGIRPVEIVNSLPAAGTQGRTVFLTTDNKLYRDTGTAWVATVASADITGQLTDAQVAALAASKITGQLSDSQLASIAAAKVAGQLTSDQIASIAAAKVSGQLTSDQIASIAAAKVSGQLANSQIADLAATKITGTLSDSQLSAIAAAKITGQITGTQITNGAISTPKLAAGAVTANEIAANTITAAKIASGTITATELASGSVTTAKLVAGAVTANEIATNAITAVKISAGAVETAKLAAGAVTADTIASNAITAVKISAGAVETAKLAAGAVTADTIATNAVTAVKISAGAVETAKLAVGAVTANTIATNAITAVKISAGAVETAKIAAGAVTATQIAAATITGDKIAANTITASNIAADTITAGQIATGAINTDELAANAVTAAKIAAGTITATQIAGSTITGDKIAGATITGNKIAANTITASNIAADTITAGQIATGAINTDELAANAVTAAKIAAGTITATQIAGLTITGDKIAGATITGNKIAANTITASNIAADTITAGQIATGAINTDELAANAVTAAKIAAGTITATQIASSTITATQIASATITGDKIAANTITASNIAADTITAGQIAAGAVNTSELATNAITSDKIAANAITSQKLLVTGIGTSITNDPNTQDVTAWTGGTFSIVTDTASPTGRALEVTSAGSITTSNSLVPIDSSKNYNARIWARQISGSPLSYLLIAFYDGNGNLLVGADYPTGWPGVGTFHYFGRINELIPSSWTQYEIAFGPNEAAQIPSSARFVRIGMLANYTGAGTSRFTRLVIAEKASGALIVDGAITANKISTNAVTADKIQAGAVSAAKISVTNLAAISADMGSITAGNIVLPSGGFIRSGQTAYNTGTGFYIGNDSGTPRFSFGNASGKNIRWDGSDLTVNGGIIVTNSVATNAITANAADTPANVTLTSANTGVENTLSTVVLTATGSTNVLIRCDLTFKFTLASGSLINIYKIKRGATVIATIPITSLASAGTYRVPLQYLDSPSAGSTTYTIVVEPTLGGSTTYLYEDIITVATEFKR